MSLKNSKSSNNLVFKYLGLAFQIMVSLALAVFVGVKTDNYFKLKMPLMVWILPLLVVVATIWQIIKDTSKKQ